MPVLSSQIPLFERAGLYTIIGMVPLLKDLRACVKRRHLGTISDQPEQHQPSQSERETGSAAAAIGKVQLPRRAGKRTYVKLCSLPVWITGIHLRRGGDLLCPFLRPIPQVTRRSPRTSPRRTYEQIPSQNLRAFKLALPANLDYTTCVGEGQLFTSPPAMA